MHQGDIYPIPKEKSDRDIELPAGTDDRQYMKILREVLPELIDRSRPRSGVAASGLRRAGGRPAGQSDDDEAGDRRPATAWWSTRASTGGFRS